MAEVVRFELTDPFESPVFKAGAIDHSTKLPKLNIDAAESNCFPSQLPLGPRALSLELYIEWGFMLASMKKYWCARWDSNPQNLVSETSPYTNSGTCAKRISFCLKAEQTCMVRPVGLEPTASSF